MESSIVQSTLVQPLPRQIRRTEPLPGRPLREESSPRPRNKRRGWKETQEEDLPESLEDLKETIGLAATLILVQRFGGVRLCVPKLMKEDHILVYVMGFEATQRLIRHFGGEILMMPRAAHALRRLRNREIATRYDSGESVRTLAQIYRLTERQIYAILAVQLE